MCVLMIRWQTHSRTLNIKRIWGAVRGVVPKYQPRLWTPVVSSSRSTGKSCSTRIVNFLSYPSYFWIFCQFVLWHEDKHGVFSPKSTGTNRMEDYLPDEFVLIGCRHRTDSMQPETISFLRRGRTCTPFSSSGGPNGLTERAQIKYCLMDIDLKVDGCGHILCTTRCCCAVACAKGYRS